MRIEKLGPIKSCNINLSQQTIFFGKNNMGKTYASYLFYGVFKKLNAIKNDLITTYVKHQFEQVKDELTFKINIKDVQQYLIENSVERLNKEIKKELPKIFNLAEEDFKESKVLIEKTDVIDFLKGITQQDILEHFVAFVLLSAVTIRITSTSEFFTFELVDIQLLRRNAEGEEWIEQALISDAFQKSIVRFLTSRVFFSSNILYIPAERNGINVFRKELALKRTSSSFEMNEEDKHVELYPLPVSDYMRYLTLLDMEQDETDNDIRIRIWKEFSTSILNGKYEYDKELNEYYYREVFSVNSNSIRYKKNKIPLKIASSSIKSLFGLEYYLKHDFSPGDILFIDEPEMNLDPQNQLKMAGILSELSKNGVRLIISSHSDYLIKATTNEFLKEKVTSGKELNTIGYYFEDKKVTRLDRIAESEYIELFDDTTRELDDVYFKFKNQLSLREKNVDHQTSTIDKV